MRTMLLGGLLALAGAGWAGAGEAGRAALRVDVSGNYSEPEKVALLDAAVDGPEAKLLRSRPEPEGAGSFLFTTGVGEAGFAPEEWTPYAFSFTPGATGTVIVSFMGKYWKAPGAETNAELWVAYDDAQAEGALLLNGDFEERADDGRPLGWEALPANIVVDEDGAFSGEAYAVAWHNRPLRQALRVEKGVRVTVRFHARAVATP